MNYFATTGLLCLSVVGISSYSTYSALNSIVFTNIPTPKDNEHSEYFFGKCATRSKTLLARDTIDYEDIKGHLIIRGHLDLKPDRTPNCVYLKGTSDLGDMIWYNSYKFTVCFIKIVHIMGGKVYARFYYEWFVPVQMQSDVVWDLYFYEA